MSSTRNPQLQRRIIFCNLTQRIFAGLLRPFATLLHFFMVLMFMLFSHFISCSPYFVLLYFSCFFIFHCPFIFLHFCFCIFAFFMIYYLFLFHCFFGFSFFFFFFFHIIFNLVFFIVLLLCAFFEFSCFFFSSFLFFHFLHFFIFQVFSFFFARRPLGRTFFERLRDEPTAPSRDLRLVTARSIVTCASAVTMLDSSQAERLGAQARHGGATRQQAPALVLTLPCPCRCWTTNQPAVTLVPNQLQFQPSPSPHFLRTRLGLNTELVAAMCSRSTLEDT